MSETIQSNLPCCLTGSHRAQLIATKGRDGNPLRTVICVDSGLVFTDPRPTAEEIEIYYRENYRKDYKRIEIPKPKHIVRAGRLATQRIAELSRYVPKGGRVLDVGAGGGEFVYLCGRSGFAARGVEPNQGYATFSQQQYGIDVQLGSYQNANLKPNSLDCITMFHVMEHLEEPVESLIQLASYVRTGGHIYVEVPNVDCTQTSPANKWHFAHLYNFNQQTLAGIGVRAGLKVVRCWAHSGGISAIYQKSDEPAEELSSVLAGSFDRTYSILRSHTTTVHYLRLHVPLSRLTRKIRKNMDEKKFAKACGAPKSMLDQVFSESVRAVKAA